MRTSRDVLLYYPNLIGYARLLCMLLSFALFLSHPTLTLFFYLVAFGGDVVDGYVARTFNQSSGFGGVLDMVTDRVSTCGFLSLLSHIYPSYTLAIVLLVTLDISSHWFHVLSVTGHHKSSESLRGRIFIMRWFYEVYPFFAYCCAGTEFFYVLAYVHFHFPSQYSSLGLYVCGPACVFKQIINIAQLASACNAIATKDAEEFTLKNQSNSGTKTK